MLAAAVVLLPAIAHAQVIEAWVQRYDGQAKSEQPVAMAADAHGNVIVTGVSYGETLKYSSAGVPLWTNRFSGPEDGYSAPAALAMDASGNVLVTGQSCSSDVSVVLCTTAKYSPDGLSLWTRSAQASDSWGGQLLAVDPSGNVIVTCQPPWNGSNHDVLTIRYSSEGVQLWAKRYNGPSNSDDWPAAVVTDAAGNAVITSCASTSTGSKSATIKYSGDGVLLWTNSYGALAKSALALWQWTAAARWQ